MDSNDSSLIQSLLKDREVLQQELSLTREEVVAQTREKEKLLREVERLKAGRFTDEEFQNLCHTFSPEKVCQFRRGCLSYQIQLFGREAVQVDMAREMRYALKEATCKEGVEMLAEMVADAIVPSPAEGKLP